MQFNLKIKLRAKVKGLQSCYVARGSTGSYLVRATLF